MKIIHDLTPLVEQISIDEAFIDVTDLPDAGEQIARRLQAKILQEFNLPCSFGIASNKLVKIIRWVNPKPGKGNHLMLSRLYYLGWSKLLLLFRLNHYELTKDSLVLDRESEQLVIVPVS
jgi:DNA polymerase-4